MVTITPSFDILIRETQTCTHGRCRSFIWSITDCLNISDLYIHVIIKNNRSLEYFWFIYSCVIYSYIHISIINQHELLGLIDLFFVKSYVLVWKFWNFFQKITYHNMTNSSNRDFMDELVRLWIYPQDHVPSYLHKVYRRKFRFWSLEHITIFSLAHVQPKPILRDNENCQMNVVF